MKKYAIIALVSMFMLQSCEILNQLPLKPSNLEVISALKNILNSSTFKAINTISNINQNGVEGLLPKEVQPVLATLKTLGLDKEINQVTSQINNASGLVLKESKGIMNDAVKELSFSDAASVVLGGKHAATDVLKKAMYASVKKRYSQRLNSEFQKNDVNKYWPMAASAYNMFSSKKVDGNLSDFVAERAVDLLFSNVAKEEEKIRNNYRSLGSDVVNKVFDYYTKQ